MKTLHKTLFFLLLGIIILGCNKNSIPISNDDEKVTIELDKSYIQFGSGVSTRASLISGYLNSNFAVLGYQYRGEWEGEKIFATPNVFKELNSDRFALPQIVKYDDGIYTYDPIQAWTGNTYSFFGYYPSEHSSITLFEDGKSQQGVPYITYTHPDSGDPSSLVDVMTASFIDTKIGYDDQGNEINYEVNLEMQHRMSAIDLRARNYYKDNDGVPLTIQINSLIFEPIVTYKKAKFYLDGTTEGIPLEASQNGNLSYPIVSNNPFDVRPNSSEDTSLREITSSSNETTILLIPQDTQIEGKLELSYKMMYEDGTYITDESGAIKVKPVTFDLGHFKRTLIEGRRYYIEITFTSDAVSLNINTADEWEEIEDDVIMEFE